MTAAAPLPAAPEHGRSFPIVERSCPVLRNDWVKQYDANALDALSLAVARAGGKIYRQVDGLK